MILMLKKKYIILFLILSLVLYSIPEAVFAENSHTAVKEGVSGPAVLELQPVSTPDPVLTVSPLPAASAQPLALKNKGAKFYAGGQKGIRYGKIKKGKIYHINCFVSDEVKLITNQTSIYKVTGGISKKDISSGKIKVSSDGTVRCKDRAKNKKQYGIVKITSKSSGESIYVYIYFAPRLYSKSSQKQVVYQGKTTRLSYNYTLKNIRLVSSNPKVAGVSKKGVVTARKKGIAVITAKVKKSEKNICRTRIVVKEEPWLVNDKDTVYSYEDMTSDLKSLTWKYRGRASLKSLGTSEDGRNIWCLRIGNPSAGKKILIDAGIHAREWLNPLMIMRKSEEILRQYVDYKATLSKVCVYIVPMINPDGVAISQYGFGAIRSKKLRKICEKTKSSYRTWKGNARGVNLNFNFPGGWNRKHKSKKPDGISYPGKKAASEKETKVMISFVNSLQNVKGALNYHSTGSILYWNYNVESTPELYVRQRAFAAKVNSFTRYRLMPKSISTDPNGGFGDWLIYNKKIPNVTVETGHVMCPLPHSQLKRITNENSELLTWFVNEYAK